MIGRLRRNFFSVYKSYGVRTLLTILLIFIQWNYQDSFPASAMGGLFCSKSRVWKLLVVPPVSLTARALHRLSLRKARATSVIPVWLSSSFWPLLTSRYKQFMKGCFQQNGTEALTSARNLNSFRGSVKFTGNVVAVIDWNFCSEILARFVYFILRVTVVHLSTVVWHWSWKGWMCLEKWHWSYAEAIAYRSVSWSTWVSRRGQDGRIYRSHVVQDFM